MLFMFFSGAVRVPPDGFDTLYPPSLTCSASNLYITEHLYILYITSFNEEFRDTNNASEFINQWQITRLDICVNNNQSLLKHGKHKVT